MILEVKDLSYNYFRGRDVFHDVSFSVDRGEIFTILGVNGAGKSTLLNCIGNLFAPQKGSILLNGRNMRSMKLTDIAHVVGYVPQTHQAIYAFSVLEFVVMGRTPNIGILSSPKKEDYDVAYAALEQMHISHLAQKPYTEISGGERQLAMIARVLTQQPQLILLDEPTAHLDYGNQYRTVSMVQDLAKQGFAVVMTTHMPDHAIVLDGKVGILDRSGHLTAGRTQDVLTEEHLSSLYQIPIKIQYADAANRNICVICSDTSFDSFLPAPSA